MKEEKRYDLHCHSLYSDGKESPEELICLAKATGLQGLSITDHDTIDAYSPELFAFAKEQEMLLVPGVEFSTYYEVEGVHLLGYGFDYMHEGFRKFCAAHQERRRKRNSTILALLKRHGMIIEEEELASITPHTPGRPHIALLLQAKGYVETLQEAFHKWIGEGKPCFSPGEIVTLHQTIDIIHRAHGKAIVAHPILIKKKRILKKIVLTPIDGLEAYYARFSKEQNQRIIELAASKNLIATGGSDYHGANKPYSILGSAYTDSASLARLLS